MPRSCSIARALFLISVLDINALIQVGRCRKHAPTINGYPVVYMNDWCGDHKLDENKA